MIADRIRSIQAVSGGGGGGGGFDPTTYGGLLRWYSASDVILDSGTNVTQFNDKSGNGNHATQATTTKQPVITYLPSGTVVRFDGVDDIVNFAAMTLTGDFTIYWAGWMRETGGNSAAFFGQSEASPNSLNTYNQGTYWYNGSDILQGNINRIATGNFYTITATRTGTTIKCEIGSFDNSTQPSNSNPTIGQIGKAFTGYSQHDLGEFLVYNQYHDAATRQAFRDWIYSNYNPYSTLPVSGAALWLDGADSSTIFKDAGVTPVSVAGDLIYQWSDKSGNNRHATQATSSNRPTWVPPASGQNGFGALSFNGTTNQLAGDQLRYTTNMSIEAVFKATSVSGTWRKIAAQSYESGWSVNPYSSWQLGLNNGYLHCGFSVTSNYLNNGLNSTGAISSNTWYHAVATFENGVFKLYINGLLNNSVDKSASGTTIRNGSAGALTIGNSYSGVPEFFQGLMAHLSVYPQTLSSTDVATLYNYQKAKWGIS